MYTVTRVSYFVEDSLCKPCSPIGSYIFKVVKTDVNCPDVFCWKVPAKDAVESVQWEKQLLSKRFAESDYIIQICDDSAIDFDILLSCVPPQYFKWFTNAVWNKGIIMPFFLQGDLFDWFVGKYNNLYTPVLFSNLVKRVIRCVNEVHINQLVHRDLKLEQFLLRSHADGDYYDTIELVLIDFGTSCIVADNDDSSDQSNFSFSVPCSSSSNNTCHLKIKKPFCDELDDFQNALSLNPKSHTWMWSHNVHTKPYAAPELLKFRRTLDSFFDRRKKWLSSGTAQLETFKHEYLTKWKPKLKELKQAMTSPALDWFSVGVLLFMLVYRAIPFNEASDHCALYCLYFTKPESFWNYHNSEWSKIQQQQQQQQAQTLSFLTVEHPPHFDANFKLCIQGLWSENQSERWNYEQLTTCEWYKQLDNKLHADACES